MKTPGQSTSEYLKSQRAEGYGIVLGLVGMVIVFLTPHAESGAAIVVAGVYLIAHTTSHYARGRSDIKAASVRRPADVAPHRSL